MNRVNNANAISDWMEDISNLLMMNNWQGRTARILLTADVVMWLLLIYFIIDYQLFFAAQQGNYYVASHFNIGALCIPTPFFVDYWVGYWIVIEIKKDDNLNDIYITLHNLITHRSITLPLHDISTYFVVISRKPDYYG